MKNIWEKEIIQCIVCGKDAYGFYEELPVCFDCYESGKLLDWLGLKSLNTYSTVRQKSTRKRKEKDYYPTPEPLINAAVERFMKDENLERYNTCDWSILEPGCGNYQPWLSKAFNDCVYPTNEENIYPLGTGIDINDFVQFGTYDEKIVGDYLEFYNYKWSPFDLIVGNPPFSLADQFIHRSFELLKDGGYIYFLLRLAFLEGRKRQLSLYEQFPLKRVYVLTRRPSFFSTKEGRNTTDTLAYAMFLWQKGYKGKPELDWLYWENE